MSSDRWSYHVEEVKPRLFGNQQQDIQERLNTLGRQGWELVSVAQTHPMRGVHMYFKKEMA